MDLAAYVRSKFCRPTAPTVLELDLNHGVMSSSPTDPREALRALHAPTMRAIRDGLRDAAHDDSVAGLVVHVGQCPLSVTQVDELAGLLQDFGAHKPTVAYSESFGELTSGLFGYRLAAHCQQVWLQPSGSLGIQGILLTVTLLRNTLGKIGIEPQFAQRHEYKTAANQFTATEVTEPQREMMQQIADSLVAETANRVAAVRGLSVEDVRDAIDHAPLTATQALERKLIDRIGYRDEVYGWLTENWGKVATTPKPSAVDGPSVALRYVHRYSKNSGSIAAAKQLLQRNQPSIALVSVQGPIVTGTGQRSLQGGQAGADPICAQLRAARNDDNVKAVIVRVDSPGGSYVASDSIRREVIGLRESGRPVIASMGDLAASGGYFVSMAANEIVANPSTLTGSIGVLAGKMVMAEVSDKLGLIREDLIAGANAGFFSSTTTFSEQHWELLNNWLDEVYADFTAKAAHDRGLELDVLEPLARGRVWTGADAAERKLVDHLGGMDLALDRACALAELDRAEVALHAGSPFAFLAALRPAESSESPRQASIGADPLPPIGKLAAAAGGGIEGLWQAVAQVSGLAPSGVLSMPFQVSVS